MLNKTYLAVKFAYNYIHSKLQKVTIFGLIVTPMDDVEELYNIRQRKNIFFASSQKTLIR